MSLAIGQILKERYRIEGLLGQGGFGAVYLAYDTNFAGQVAIKESLDASPQAEVVFKREASLLFKLDHPNLPHVLDWFSLPGQGQYLVMRYIAGQDLQEQLDERDGRPFAEQLVLIWIGQVCDALIYLHNQQPPIIHRDIKPANIRITPQGRAVLVDFGIAKLYNPSLMTTVAAQAGTPGYTPPEQYKQGGTDVRSDIYALGATLYKLLTGTTPPDSLDISTGEAFLPPVSELNQQVSGTVSAAISRAMQVNRSRRFASVAQLQTALVSEAIVSKQPVGQAQPDPEIAPVETMPVQDSTEQDRITPASEEATRVHPKEAESPHEKSGSEEAIPKQGQAQVQRRVATTPQIVKSREQVPDKSTAGGKGGKKWIRFVFMGFVGLGSIALLIGGLVWSGITRQIFSVPVNNLPTMTGAIVLTSTNTPEPTSTETLEPTSTDTPEPTSTDVPEPTSTDTPKPTATNTPEPTSTDTQEPTSTYTPVPTHTNTPVFLLQEIKVTAVNNEVVATRGWNNTQLYVTAGRRLQIKYISGLWSPWPGGYYDANGVVDSRYSLYNYPKSTNQIMDHVPHACLIGKINGQTFYVGNKLDSRPAVSGYLYLRINDNVLSDDRGSIWVYIIISPP